MLSVVLLLTQSVLTKARVSSVLSSKHKIDGWVCSGSGKFLCQFQEHHRMPIAAVHPFANHCIFVPPTATGS